MGVAGLAGMLLQGKLKANKIAVEVPISPVKREKSLRDYPSREDFMLGIRREEEREIESKRETSNTLQI